MPDSYVCNFCTDNYDKGVEKITLTYLNVRQSIAILLGKIIVLDIIFAVVVAALYLLIVPSGVVVETVVRNIVIFLVLFFILGIFKFYLTTYVVMEWLNEYYEITPDEIVHKKGVVKKRSETYHLDKVGSIDVQHSFFGELFNFATISLYDSGMHKLLDMYLIHNPKRYEKILRTLIPNPERKKTRVQLPFLPKDEEVQEKE